MKIKNKFLFLVGGTMAAFIAAIVLYFVILLPVETMRTESEYFGNLSRAASTVRADIGRLAFDNYEEHKSDFEDSAKKYTAAMEDMGKVVLLPQQSKDLADAVDAVVNLKDLVAGPLGDIGPKLDQVIKDGQVQFSQNLDPSILKLQAAAMGSEAVKGSSTLEDIGDLLGSIRAVSEGLIQMSLVLDQKSQLIKTEIASIQASRMVLLGGLILLLCAIALVVSIMTTRSVTRALDRFLRSVARMSEGDLTGRLHLRQTRDEIGGLAKNLDNLLDELNRSLGEIQLASRQNIELKGQMSEAVSTSTSSAVEIEANSESIRTQMLRLDGMIRDSADKIAEIVQSVGNLSQRLIAQNGDVEGAASAVTQMLASIENITRISELDRKTTEELVTVAQEGRDVLEDSFERIAGITASVEAIQEMATVIDEIASQTNLLAMNAAIEAAHAGDFGKGFAVVADEITKLAAASASNSREIATTIKNVIQKIDEAAATKETTTLAFNAITERINEVSTSNLAIYSNLGEMHTGSHRILTSMEHLRDASATVTQESGHIQESCDVVGHSIVDVGRISHEVTSNIGEITEGLGEITRSIHLVADQAEKIGTIGEDLDRAVNRFKTDAQA